GSSNDHVCEVNAQRGSLTSSMVRPGSVSSRRVSTMPPTVSPVLSVHPTRALVDETFRVVVENLPPASPVTLHSLHLSEDKDYWEAYGHYISDHRGSVSVAEDLSFGGTYTGKEPMGLLWSMRPVPGSRKGLRLRKMDVCSPMLVNISVYGGHVAEGFMEQPPLASVLTERWYMAPGVQRIDIKEEEVIGTLFIPPGPGPFPGLLDMWGGGGGLVEYRAALLASHGYVSFALKYLDHGEMKSAGLELKYFETAFNMIKDHPRVSPDRVGIFGLSLGSIVSMYLLAYSTVIKAISLRVVLQPRCCVCVSGSHITLGGGTFGGFLQEFFMNYEKIRMDENDYHVWRDMALTLTNNPSKKLDMAQTMQAAGNDHLLTLLQYPDTGHLIEPPYSPHFRATNFLKDSRKEKVILLWGGQTKPHSDAQEDSWKKILSFLQHHLYSSSTPKAKM
ncbi:hypothetical protein L3Q82_009293, partial [Scortum barcoo]